MTFVREYRASHERRARPWCSCGTSGSALRVMSLLNPCASAIDWTWLLEFPEPTATNNVLDLARSVRPFRRAFRGLPLVWEPFAGRERGMARKPKRSVQAVRIKAHATRIRLAWKPPR